MLFSKECKRYNMLNDVGRVHIHVRAQTSRMNVIWSLARNLNFRVPPRPTTASEILRNLKVYQSRLKGLLKQVAGPQAQSYQFSQSEMCSGICISSNFPGETAAAGLGIIL